MKTSHKHGFLLLLAAAGLTIAATSCHTVRGVGRDVQRTGQTIENAAR